MADRSVKVRLLADITSYRAAFREASAVTKDFGAQLQKGGRDANQVMTTIGHGGLVMSAAMVGGFGLAINAALGFDRQLSELGAVTGATAAEMDDLRDAAIEAGKATQYSASQAAAAQTELAKAGISTADILSGGLTGALDLAAAGGLDLADAATAAANAMTTFGLTGTDVEHIADVLAAGANKSAANVGDITQALAQSGLVADQFGLSLDDTVGVLSAFAQAGLRGSDAGTSLKTALQRLVPQSAEASQAMSDLGIDMFDAHGQFIGIEAAAQELHDGLSDLSDEQRASALQTIFGSDAIRAATILYQEGADGVAEWVDNVDDAGFAAQVAAERTDNLSGDLERLGGSIETALIQGGSKATDTLRFLTTSIDTTVQGFSDMPGPLQDVGLGLGAITAAGAGIIGIIGTLAPKVSAFKSALDELGTGGKFVSRNLGTMATALSFAGVAVAGLSWYLGHQAQQQAVAQERVDRYTQAILDQNDALGAGLDTSIAHDLATSKWGTTLREVGININALTDGITSSTDAVRGLDDALGSPVAKAQFGMRELQETLDDVGLSGSAFGDQMIQIGQQIPQAELADFVGLVSSLADSSSGAATAASNQSYATNQVGGSASGARSGVQDLTTDIANQRTELEKASGVVDDYVAQLRGLTDPVFAIVNAQNKNSDAQRDYARSLEDVQRAQDDLNAAVRDPESTPRDRADAQRHLEDALVGVRDAEIGLAESGADLNAQQAELAGRLRTGELKLGDVETALGDLATQGYVTTGVVEGLNTQLEGAATRADALHGQRIEILLDLNIDHALKNLQLFYNQVAQANNVGQIFETTQQTPQRWGGIVNAYAGGGIHAHVARNEVIRYAEPATGGEAMVPRLGNYGRSKAVLDEAAGWYGLQVVPAGGDGASLAGEIRALRAEVSSMRGITLQVNGYQRSVPEIVQEASMRLALAV